MKNKILFFLIIIFLFKCIYNGDPVSEMKADEEHESDCYLTQNPQSTSDCLNREVFEDDEICCLFEIENHKKESITLCSGLTEFQYNHIKLYVKEKMDELLYRDLHIHCKSFILKTNFLLLLFFYIYF